ncbi:MAG: sulfurtransferase [Flavobacteriales bacterium]|nr:sulfurtransferase [Flavobacteriales bacterium]
MPSPLLSAAAFLSLINGPELVILDATFGPNAQEQYLQSHIKGAHWVDLNRQLSDIGPDPSRGGRHPLPSASDFAQTLGKLGIDPTSKVAIYDRNFGALAAARCWWMLRSMGHENAWVIDGGLQAIQQEGGIISSSQAPEPAEKPPYPTSEWQLPLLSMRGLEERKGEGSVLIDVREADRFNGIHEPIDLIAGHIPGALNVPYTQNLNEDGTFKSPEALSTLYGPLIGKDEDVAFYCGSGVTACHGILALAHATGRMAALYPGSWSEWSRNEH